MRERVPEESRGMRKELLAVVELDRALQYKVRILTFVTSN